ncbi:hypothetical protein ACFWA4_35365 [Streptomyces sp. NPDC060011]|nr:hypothetical protein [Streptomyces sp. NBC_00340]MCX5135041.1 hypothetical protein [Streptomyces sp. NBC_00340]
MDDEVRIVDLRLEFFLEEAIRLAGLLQVVGGARFDELRYA